MPVSDAAAAVEEAAGQPAAAAATPVLEAIDDALATRVLARSPRVRRLNLAHNGITCAGLEAYALARLGGLLYLCLARNRLLGALPAALASLTNLQSLDVSSNELDDVRAVASLRALRRLDVSDNLLARLDQFRALADAGLDLLTLRLTGNPLCSSLPSEQQALFVRSHFPNVEREDCDSSRASRRGPGSVSSSARTLTMRPPLLQPLSLFEEAAYATARAKAALAAAVATRSAGSSRAATPVADAVDAPSFEPGTNLLFAALPVPPPLQSMPPLCPASRVTNAVDADTDKDVGEDEGEDEDEGGDEGEDENEGDYEEEAPSAERGAMKDDGDKPDASVASSLTMALAPVLGTPASALPWGSGLVISTLQLPFAPAALGPPQQRLAPPSLLPPALTPARPASLIVKEGSPEVVRPAMVPFRASSSLHSTPTRESGAPLQLQQSALLSRLDATELQLEAQDAVLCDYERTLASAFARAQAAVVDATASEEGGVPTAEEEAEADAGAQAAAFSLSLASLRRDVVAARCGEAAARRESIEARASVFSLQQAVAAASAQAEALAREAQASRHAALQSERQLQAERRQASAEAAVLEAQLRAREEAVGEQQRLRRLEAVESRRVAEHSAQGDRSLVLEVRQQLADARAEAAAAAELRARNAAEQAEFARQVGLLQTECEALRYERLQLQQQAQADRARAELAEALLQGERSHLAAAQRAAVSGRLQARSAEDGVGLLGAALSESGVISEALRAGSRGATALQQLAGSALSQLGLRVARCASQLQSLHLGRAADEARHEELQRALTEERAAWAAQLGMQASRLTEIATARNALALARRAAALLGVDGEEADERDVSDAVEYDPPSSAAAASARLRERQRQLSHLQLGHEEAVQEGARALASACALTDFAADIASGADEGADGDGDESAIPEAAAPLSSAVSLLPPLLTPEALRRHLDAADSELHLLRPRLRAALRLVRARDSAVAAASAARVAAAERALECARAELVQLSARLQSEAASAVAARLAADEALARCDAARVRQVTAARDAALRARATNTQLEARLAGLQIEAAAARAEVSRLEAEVSTVTSRHAAEHRAALDGFAERLEAALGAAAKASRLKEDVLVLRRERDTLLAALANSKGGDN